MKDSKFNGFIVLLIVSAIILYGCTSSNKKISDNLSTTIEKNTSHQIPTTTINTYLGVPCASSPKLTFSHDLTEPDKIIKITPTSMIARKLQDRVFLWIDTSKTDKVPIYAPIDADLVSGVYKISRGIDTIDYDLHFQVSCENWFYINHISDPIEKIKKVLPDKPANDTKNFIVINPVIHFKAGDLIGYTTGTGKAHNFDFAVFDLNHSNELIGEGGSSDSRFKNFICPFDPFPEIIKNTYYQKLDPNLTSESNCR